MKYATNHAWKFRDYKTAFTAGFLQAISAMVITSVNYLVILSACDALELAKDFTALMVIAQIDNYFYDASRLTLLKNILDYQADDYEELFNIETTTSVDASDNQNVELEEDPILDTVKENTK